MTSIAKIVKTTIENLNSKNIVATPNNYEKEFYSILSQSDITTNDFEEFKKVLTSLDEKELELVKNLDISTSYELTQLLKNRISESEIKNFLKHLSYFFTPSLDKNFQEDIDSIFLELTENPSKIINNKDTLRDLRNLTYKRVEKDTNIYNEKTQDVKKLVDFLYGFFSKGLNENKVTLDDITTLKDEFDTLSLSPSSKDDINLLQIKLFNLMSKFQTCVQDANNSLNQNQETCQILYEKIEKLEEDLTKANEEKSIDFLTNVLTKRAYCIEVDKTESEYELFHSKYALIFYDIDHFKEVNDTYGHDAGDTVLSTFASILKKLTRKEDVIARFGGEEFISLIHYENKLEIKNYLMRVKNIINGNKFIHEDHRIELTFCAGVAFREKYDSYEQTIKKADELLYKAKNDGRNKIILDTGDIY